MGGWSTRRYCSWEYRECVYPSPVTALGMGYKRSIKPDLIAPGGRQLFRARPGGGNRPTTIVSPVMSSLAPGLLVATPSAQAGALNERDTSRDVGSRRPWYHIGAACFSKK